MSVKGLKKYNINGRELILGGVLELAKAVERSSSTIRTWEARGIIPRAGWRTAAGVRLYLEEEIQAMCEIVKRINIKTGRNIASTKFRVEVLDAWSKIRAKYGVTRIEIKKLVYDRNTICYRNGRKPS